jgi:hypothetical protein
MTTIHAASNATNITKKQDVEFHELNEIKETLDSIGIGRGEEKEIDSKYHRIKLYQPHW